MNWDYLSTNLPGNLHDAARHINEHHPDWDVVAMHFNGGHHTVVVYRIERKP